MNMGASDDQDRSDVMAHSDYITKIERHGLRWVAFYDVPYTKHHRLGGSFDRQMVVVGTRSALTRKGALRRAEQAASIAEHTHVHLDVTR